MNADVPDQLRLLALIDRYGSLAGAALALGLTAAAVTQRLAKAERDWDVRLVQRGARGARLTPAGRVLVGHGRAIDVEAERAVEAMATFRGEASRRLRIGAFQAAAMHLLPPALTALRHRHPGADLSLVDTRSNAAIRSVTEGTLDVAILATWDSEPVVTPHIRVQLLMSDPLVVVLPDDHRLARGKTGALRLAQLRDDAWVLIRAGHAARAQFDRAAEEAGFTPKVRFETESYDVAQALVATGIGVALVSRLALTRLPGTTPRPLVKPGLRRELHAVLPADTTLTPLADTFLELLTDVAREISDTWR